MRIIPTWLRPAVAPAHPTQARLVSRDRRESLQVTRVGMQRSWGDVYHFLLTVSWPWLLLIVGVVYVGVNALFAILYLLGGDTIANAQPGSFGDAFFFSAQTLATVGYGTMLPKTVYGQVIATAEPLVGWIGFAMATSLIFNKFSRPTARVLFSDVAVIYPKGGVQILMFRAANQRRNQILEAQVRVTLVRDEYGPDGSFMRRFYDMEMVRSASPVFFLTWSLIHVIDEKSPLFGVTPESLAKAQTEIIVLLTGLDETVSQTIHSRHSYISDEIVWNQQLADIIQKSPDGKRLVDYNHFHETVTLPDS